MKVVSKILCMKNDLGVVPYLVAERLEKRREIINFQNSYIFPGQHIKTEDTKDLINSRFEEEKDLITDSSASGNTPTIHSSTSFNRQIFNPDISIFFL
jgi:hypothetical protein